MKSFLRRFISVALLLLLPTIFCFQSVALAAPNGDEGERAESRKIAKKVDIQGGSGGGGGGWGIFDIFQRPRPSIAPNLEKIDRLSPTTDRERKDTVREVTGKSHMPGGGPQDP